MNIIFPNNKKPEKPVDGYYIVPEDHTLCFIQDEKTFIFDDVSNTFIIEGATHYRESELEEIEFLIDYDVPRKYKSIDKHMNFEYFEKFQNTLNISGIFLGISMVTKYKYLFMVNENCDEVLMLDKNDDSITVVSKEFLTKNYDYFLISDEVEENTNLTFSLKFKGGNNG